MKMQTIASKLLARNESEFFDYMKNHAIGHNYCKTALCFSSGRRRRRGCPILGNPASCF